MPRQGYKFYSAAFAAVLLAGIGLASPQVASAAGKGDSGASTSITAPSLSSLRSTPTDVGPAGYWTEDKMRNAIPADDIAVDDHDTAADRPSAG